MKRLINCIVNRDEVSQIIHLKQSFLLFYIGFRYKKEVDLAFDKITAMHPDIVDFA
ncbi:hypothetical protein [Flavobacterium frigoris]|uniref:Uncharacterized protein n=1 Tax=Flavobacterium frigoris (strain PS1) TaxID=1086011 RepID=H7FS13_FLAFP|nr:hypothetical protein [Flavobacterium frigoris]EIA08441.1 hypothetical protein HJ01_02163 [Flavobacterium frigoris PS1]